MFPLNCANQAKVEGEEEGSEAPKGTFPRWPLSSGGCTLDVVVKGGGHDSPARRRVNYRAFVRVGNAYRRICFFFLIKAEV